MTPANEQSLVCAKHPTICYPTNPNANPANCNYHAPHFWDDSLEEVSHVPQITELID